MGGFGRLIQVVFLYFDFVDVVNCRKHTRDGGLMNSYSFRIFGLAMLAVALTGCPPKKQVVEETPPVEDSDKASLEEPSLRGKDYQEVPDLKAILFETDQATLKPEARSTLQQNYNILKQKADWE